MKLNGFVYFVATEPIVNTWYEKDLTTVVVVLFTNTRGVLTDGQKS